MGFNEELEAALSGVTESENAVLEIMAKLYPIGTDISFTLSSRQVKPSTGTVMGHGSNGSVRVKHHQAKPGSRYSRRLVHHGDITSQPSNNGVTEND